MCGADYNNERMGLLVKKIVVYKDRFLGEINFKLWGY